jgi:non-ribosomal peptide synthetase component F
LNTIIQAAWAVVLGKYNGIEDVVFGAVVSGRPAEIEGIESIVGLFINTIPVRVRFESATLFSELSGNLQQAAIASEPHHYCPLVDIQSLSTLKQNLLDHILTFENFPVESELDEMASANGETNRKLLLEISNVKAYVRSNYDLEVEIVPKDRLKITLRYNDNVYEKKIVEKVGHHFCSILEQAAHNMEVKIEEFDLLTGDKKEKMLNRFNDEL